jgi:hypothetical protein
LPNFTARWLGRSGPYLIVAGIRQWAIEGVFEIVSRHHRRLAPQKAGLVDRSVRGSSR